MFFCFCEGFFFQTQRLRMILRLSLYVTIFCTHRIKSIRSALVLALKRGSAIN